MRKWPANLASNSSLLLGTILFVEGTNVQQGQWTLILSPRFLSKREKKDNFSQRSKHFTTSSASSSSKYTLKLLDEPTDLWTPSTPSQSLWRRRKATPPWREALLFWSLCTSETLPSRRQIWESVGVKGNKPQAYLTYPFIHLLLYFLHCAAWKHIVQMWWIKPVQMLSLQYRLAAHLWNNSSLLSGKTTGAPLTWYISTRCSVVRACGFGALKMRNSALTKVLEFRSTLVTSKPTILKYGLWGSGLIESVEQRQDSLWPYLHFVVCAWFSEGQPQGNKTCFSAKTADVMTNPFQPLRSLTEL